MQFVLSGLLYKSPGRPQDWLNGIYVSSLLLMRIIHGKQKVSLNGFSHVSVETGLSATLNCCTLLSQQFIARKGKRSEKEIKLFLYLLRRPCLTCGDDPDAQATWHQVGVWLVVVHAVVRLRSGHQPVHDFAEHPVSAYTHHPENTWRLLTSDPRGQPALPWKHLNAHERHAVPPWFTSFLTTMFSQKGAYK